MIYEVLYSLVELGVGKLLPQGALYDSYEVSLVVVVACIFNTDPALTSTMYFMLGVPWSILGTSVFVAFFILLGDVIVHHREVLRQPYDFAASLSLTSESRQWSIIFGRFPVRKRFKWVYQQTPLVRLIALELSRADNRFIRCIRGGFAILCLLALSFLTLYALVGKPLQQSGRTAVKISKVSLPFLSEDILEESGLSARVVLVDNGHKILL